MIPILYDSPLYKEVNGETVEVTFDNGGIGFLKDCVKCTVTEELNGMYEAEFTYPITGQFYSEILSDRIIKVKANETSELQLFRIYKDTKPINGIVKFYAQHISYDLNGNDVTPFTQNTTNATAALTAILEHCYYNHRFTAVSSSSTQGKIELKIPVSARKCIGGMEGSVLENFGGEFEFDNFIVRHYSSRGQDNGVVIQYGKNLTDIKADKSIADVYTSIYPYALDEDGEYYELPEKVIELQSSSNYGAPRMLPLDLSNKFDSETMITATLLRQYANEFISNNSIDEIQQNIKVSFVQLWQSKEYATIALLERVKLGDIVTVKYPKLGVSVKAKVIKTVYDVLNEKYIEIELGQAKSNFADTLNKVTSEFQAMSDFMRTQPSLMEKAIQNATNLITGQTGGYIIFRNFTDIFDNQGNKIRTETLPQGQPAEMLIMDNPDITQALHVWRYNLSGWGYSSHGVNGPFALAATSDGAIVADFITTGILNADLIRAGVIRDLQNKNYWNLATGEFHLSSDVAGDVLDDLTQQQVFNILTNNSANQGIYLSNGYLMLNASYIQTGNLSADRITTGSMSANRITTGTLDASQVTVTNLNASNITSGTLDASQVSVINLDADAITSGAISANRITSGILQSSGGNTFFNLGTGTIGFNLPNGTKMRLSAATGLRMLDSSDNEIAALTATLYNNDPYSQIVADYGEFKALRIHSLDNTRVSIVNIATDNSLFAVNGLSSDSICIKADNASSNIGSWVKNAQSKSVLTTDVANIDTGNITTGKINSLTVGSSTTTKFEADSMGVKVEGNALSWIRVQDYLGNYAYVLGYNV